MRLGAAAMALVLAAGPALAGDLAISDLFPADDTPTSRVMGAGNTRYVFFEALQCVEVHSLSVFGTPINSNTNRDIRFQLFEVDSSWRDAGNASRLFYAQHFFTDVGTGIYAIPSSANASGTSPVTLESNGFYRLSFQVANTGWDLPIHGAGGEYTGPITTGDGLFRVYGGGSSFSGPRVYDGFATFSLGVAAVPLPPAAWMGLGLLAGLGVLRRMRRPAS